MRTLIWATILTPVLMLGALEGVEIGSAPTRDAAVTTTVQSSGAPTSASLSNVPAPPVTVTSDDQGDLIVDHADEPFTYTATEHLITVTPAVHTSVFIYAHRWPAHGDDHYEASHDRPTTYAELALPGGCSKVTIVVIVNNHSQVSNLSLEVGCE